MNFEFSEDQLQLRDEIRRFMASESPFTVNRSILEGNETHSQHVWNGMQALGIQSIMLPESCGGFGLGALELCIAAEEIGRQLSPVPALGTLYLVQQALLQLEESDLRNQLLAATGEGQIATLAANFDTLDTIDCQFDGHTLTGSVGVVHNATEASHFIVLAQQGNTPVLVHCPRDSSLTTKPLDLIDNSCSAGSLVLNNTPATVLSSGENVLSVVATTLDRAACLMSFEQLGAADSALEMASAFARERVAFGRVIGSYQGIKHKLVDGYTLNQLARVHCYYAAWALASEPKQLAKASASALISSSKALQYAAKENIQTHGGMGYTWEMDCHLFFKRSRHYAVALGAMQGWQKQLSQQLQRQLAQS